MIPVQLASLVVDEQAYAQQLRLNETGGSRGFTVLVGLFEALAIQRALSDARSERPLTHQLALDVLTALGGELEQVLIDKVERDARGETFHAKLILRQGDERLRIDCRPSDAIAIGLRAGVTLCVAEAVLDEVS